MNRYLNIVVMVLSIVGLTACDSMLRWGDGQSVAIGNTSGASSTAYPSTYSDSAHGVQDGDYYVVALGDTLYSIAFRYGFDFRQLAALNGIPDPYIIQPGQRILINAKVASNDMRTAPAPAPVKTPLPPSSSTRGDSRDAVPPVAESIERRGGQRWLKPTAGVVVGRYGQSPSTKNGIQIAGKLGQPIAAAKAGQVVYVGSSLKGYGNLIILKHNDEFISAYGFNQTVLVKKDQWVRAGQTIAKMGLNAQNKVMLHFEIRQQGRPVNPQNYLHN